VAGTDPSSPIGLAANPISWTNIDNFDLSWSNPADTSGIVGAYYKLDSAPTTNTDGIYVAGADIESITDISVTTDGNHTVYIWLMDNTGNIDYINFATTQLYLDTIDPSSPSGLATDPISWTNVDSFDLSWSNPIDTSGIVGAYYKLDSAPTTDIDGTYVAGADIESITDISVTTDDNHTVYLWLVDDAGNIDYINFATTQLYLDATDPSSPSNLVATPASWTNVDSFDLSWSNPFDTSGIVGAYYKLDSAPTTDTDGTYVAGADIESITGISVTIDDNHTVYIWLVDNAGNIDFINFTTTQLYLDATDPSSPSNLVATPASWTNVDIFDLSWSNPFDTSGIIGAYYSLDSIPTSDTDGTYLAGVDIESIIGISVTTDGTHMVYVWLVDNVGNIDYTNFAAVQLYLDTVNPSSPSGLIATPASWTNIDSFNLSWSNPGDTSGISGAFYKFDSVPTSNGDGVYVVGTDLESLIDISIGSDGTHTIYVWLNDSAGNIDYNNYETTQLYLDTTDPSPPSGLIATPVSWTNVDSFNISWSNPTDTSGISGVFYKFDSAPTSNGDGVYVAGTDLESLIDISIGNDGTHTIYVWLNDSAGNIDYNNYDTTQLFLDTSNPLVIESQVGDDSWRNTAGTTYDVDFSDPLPSSNLYYAQYKITSKTEQGGIILKDWTDIFINLGTTSYTTDWSVDFTACQEGINYISVRVYDEVGNFQIVNDVFYVKKDTLNPILVINTPDNNTDWNTRPPINITVYEPNFASLTYTVIGYSPLGLVNNTIVFLDPGIWVDLPQGAFQIVFTCFDDLGQFSELTITLYKDTIPPVFNSVFPSNFTYHNSHPNLTISYLDPNLDTIYYKIDASIIFIFNDTEQPFDSSIWNGLGEGPFTIEFYANDTFGEISLSLNLTLIKDTILPMITVNSPDNNTYYSTPPIMDFTISDFNHDTLWYIAMGTKVILSGVEAFDLSIWDSLGQGEFQIYIFANDSAGNLNDSIILTLFKDTLAPLVTINLPLNNTHWNACPIFNVVAYDPNLVSISYQVVGYSPIILSNNTDEYLNIFIWSGLSEGIFLVDIFAEDSLGYISDSIRLTLYKDTVQPVIDIVLPQSNDIYGEISPNFEISVSENHLNTTWYILIGESTIMSFTGFSGTIDQTIWDLFGNGTVSIRFYANDTAGNIGNKEITVQKNIYDPIITITSPGNDDLFGVTAPNFTIYKSGPLLQSTWYTLDSGITNITFTGLNGTINQTEWENFGFGITLLRFYINDSFGKIGFDVITIRKDPDPPEVTITFDYPSTNNSYCAFEPTFRVSVYEPNNHSIWYRVGMSNVFISNNTDITLQSAIWDNLLQGIFTIEIFANDTMGNVNCFNTLYLFKDTIGPNITIILPTENQKVGRTAPYFELSISDENGVDSCWYTIDGDGTTRPFAGLIGRIDQNLWEQIWDDLAQGAIITIRFCAMDTLGNEDYNELTLIVEKTVELPKFLSDPLGIIIPALGLVTMIPLTIKTTTSRYFKSLNNRDKGKLKKLLMASVFVLSLTLIFYFV